MDKESQRDAVAKLEKAVQPCLSQITWKQMIILKRVVSACFFAMVNFKSITLNIICNNELSIKEEVIQELLVNSLVEEP